MPNKVADMHFHREEEEDAGAIRRSSSRTPRGHFVVYVGTKLERFVVPTRFLKSPSFQNLLEKAAEEFGYAEAHPNKIVLPCDVSTFRSLVMFLTSHDE